MNILEPDRHAESRSYDILLIHPDLWPTLKQTVDFPKHRSFNQSIFIFHVRFLMYTHYSHWYMPCFSYCISSVGIFGLPVFKSGFPNTPRPWQWSGRNPGKSAWRDSSVQNDSWKKHAKKWPQTFCWLIFFEGHFDKYIGFIHELAKKNDPKYVYICI